MASGAKLSALQASHKTAGDKILTIEGYLDEFKTAVETMNREFWYGGESANKWYNNAIAIHKANLSFVASARNLQTEYKAQIDAIQAAMTQTF